jgi:quinol monooxygenase YgiN
MIHVIATISTTAGRRDDLIQEFRRLVPLVRAEVGCIAYEPAVDVEHGLEGQPGPRPHVVTVVEQWADLAALKAHLQAPHMIRFRDAVKDMLAGVEIRVLQPV